MESRHEGSSGEDPALTARVAALEAQVALLRDELAALRSPRPVVAAQRSPFPPAAFSAQSAPQSAPQLQHPPPAAPAPQHSHSLERQLGANVLSKVAIVLLLVGAAWFLKWAFDNQWIGPTGRVLTGLIAGVAVVLWSERFRRHGVPGFSYALKAVGSGVLYLSLWAGFHVYHLALFPDYVAFLLMVGVTAWNGVMAWSQDAPVLAGYAMAGAYATPLLLSTGGDHEVFLFSYLAAIAAFVVTLSRLKPWSLLPVCAVAVTAIAFIGWYTSYFAAPKAFLTALFVLLFWAVFAAVPLLAADGGRVWSGVVAPLGAAAFGSLALYSLLEDSGRHAWLPWCAVAASAAYLALTRTRRALPAAVHLSLAVVFLTIAIPLKASGRGITLGWLIESVALLAIATAPAIEPRAQAALRWLGSAALLLGVGGALLQQVLANDPEPAFFNAAFALSLAAVTALAATIAFARRMTSNPNIALNGSRIAALALVAANLTLLLAMHHELARGISAARSGSTATRESSGFAFSGWMMLQGAAMVAAGFWRRSPLARWIGLLLLAATALKAFVYDIRDLGTGYRVASYLGLGVLLMAISYAYQKDWLGLLVSAEDAATSQRDREAHS